VTSDGQKALALECAQLPDDGLLSVLAGQITLSEGMRTRDIQGLLRYATRGRTPAETAALADELLAFRYGPLALQAALLAPAIPSSLLTGLGMYYALEDVTDTHAHLDLTNVGTTGFGAGKRGNCAIFSGATGKRLFRATPFIAQGSGASFSVWFRTNCTGGPAGNNTIMAENVGANWGWRFYSNNSANTVTFQCRLTAGGSIPTATSPTLINNSAWHHVVGTWNNVDMKARLYLDGAAPVVTAAAATPELRQDAGGVMIGGFNATDAFGNFTLAEVDEALIYPSAVLTDAQALALWGGGTPPAYPFVGIP
jgi:Concanavalin A-like lectin/glucanases superfamily